jgi:hypothetical protein
MERFLAVKAKVKDEDACLVSPSGELFCWQLLSELATPNALIADGTLSTPV